MRNRICRILTVAAAVATGVLGSPAAAQAVQASGDWQYRMEAESCRAYRSFGSGDDRILLQLRSFGPGSAVEAMVISNQLPKEPSSVRSVELSWDGKGWERHQIGLLGSVSGLPTITVQLSHRPIWAHLEGFIEDTMYLVSQLDPSVETMQLRIPAGAPITLQTGSLQGPVAHLAQCETSLMEKWGWGSDHLQRILSAPEMRNAKSFYGAIIYPSAQVINRVGSITQLRLKVDASGKVADCVVQSSPGSSLFGSESCKRIKRLVRYNPARNLQGEAVDSFVQLSITFARYD